MDTTTMFIHGSGTIIKFDTNGLFKSFGNDFYTNDDSLTWGEPGIVLNYGNWNSAGDKILVSQELVEKTFLIPVQKIGLKQIDTFHIVGDTLIKNNNLRFTPVKLVSSEIRNFINGDWRVWKERNKNR